MIKLYMFMSFLIVFCVAVYEDVDPVIDMLLNGVSRETYDSADDNTKNDESVTVGGIWRCGNCTDLGEGRLMHSETNQIDADMDQEVDVQISLVVEGMRCVTVTAGEPGTVRKVLGTCDNSSVTLSVSPSHNFTILVYT